MFGGYGVDIEFIFYVFDLGSGQVGVGEYVVLLNDEGEVLGYVFCFDGIDQIGMYGVDVVMYVGQFGFLYLL